MKTLEYKVYSKCNLAASMIAALFIWYKISNGIQIYGHFQEAEGLTLYIVLQAVIPAVILAAISVTLFLKKGSGKIPVIFLLMYYGVRFVGMFERIISSDGITATTVWQMPLNGEAVISLLALFISILFCVLVSGCHIKASVGALVVTIANGLLIFASLVTVSTLLGATLEAALPLFVLLSMEDFKVEERAQRDIRNEKISFQKRNIAVCVVLSIVTFGIYGIVWLSRICKDIRHLHGEEAPVATEVVLIVLIPFYSWYWAVTRGRQMYEDSEKRGGNMADNKMLYLIFSVLNLAVFTMGFMQSQFNNYQNK